MYATRGDRGLAIHRAPHSGHAATATAHVRAQLTTHAMLQPSSVLKGSGSRAHEPPDDSKSMRCEPASIRPSIQSSPQDRRSAASVRLSGGLASTAASTRRFAVMPMSRPLCFRPPSCCSHHLPPSIAKLSPEHRRVDVSFSSGHKAGSGSKRCSLGVITRCVAAGGHSPRDTLSTLPARRAGRRRFARSVGRRYVPRSSALRV